MKTYWYRVDQIHSRVLGHDPLSKSGRALWDELDWSRPPVRDGGCHLLNPAGGEYLHVFCREDGRVYRVRCRHEIGSRWRSGIVRDVEVLHGPDGWYWLVKVERQNASADANAGSARSER